MSRRFPSSLAPEVVPFVDVEILPANPDAPIQLEIAMIVDDRSASSPCDSFARSLDQLDPNGVRNFFHLRSRRRDLRWFIPSFWDGLGLWPKEEPLVIDASIAPALEAML